MTSKKDIRWEQRFSNYNKSLKKLSEAIDYVKKNPKEKLLDEILKEGIIKRFEYTHELAWNLMKDFLSDIGDVKLYGSKDATREAFKAELIKDGDVWMEMIKSRNKTSHTYNEGTAQEIYFKILHEYHAAFLKFQAIMDAKIKK